MAARMAANYQFRPPYSREVYQTLVGLIRDEPRTVLDAGCGPGKIARELLNDVARIDAVDPSAEMIRVGRSLPGGDDSKIRWINSTIESAELAGPYALIVAGASFHWMKQDVALRRFSEVLAPSAMLVVLDGDAPVNPPWAAEEQDIMIELATRADGMRPVRWARMDELLLQPIVDHAQFSRVGSKVTAPIRFTQSIADYIGCLHSRATFSEEHVGEELSRAFDAAIATLLSRHAVNGRVTYDVQTRIEWGRPLFADA